MRILEIGINQGGSVLMWLNYFGPNCMYYGVDINPECKKLEKINDKKNVQIFIGDQADQTFLAYLITQIPKVDVIIDDGGHWMEQQINSLDILFPHLVDNGIYLCEDTHTSYYPGFGGGLRNPKSFIEYSKSIVDSLHGMHPWTVPEDNWTKYCDSICFYDSIAVLQKREQRIKPSCITIGKRLLSDKE